MKGFSSINEHYLTFEEVCINLGISSNQLHQYIREEKIVPAIFYYLNNGIPDRACTHNGDQQSSYSPRLDIPRLPMINYIEDVAYLHGLVTNSPYKYKFTYVALSPSPSQFRTKDNNPVEIYKLSHVIPHTNEDAKEYFIFVIEGVRQLKHCIHVKSNETDMVEELGGKQKTIPIRGKPRTQKIRVLEELKERGLTLEDNPAYGVLAEIKVVIIEASNSSIKPRTIDKLYSDMKLVSGHNTRKK